MLEKLAGALLEGKKTQLALAIARGKPVTEWARQNEVPRRTAFRWASEPSVRRAVDSCRRRAHDQAINRMAKPAVWAIKQIATLATGARSQSRKLRVQRSILSDGMAVSKFSETGVPHDRDRGGAV
jgi:hypothetical protein